jgi:hypothetical protein
MNIWHAGTLLVWVAIACVFMQQPPNPTQAPNANTVNSVTQQK